MTADDIEATARRTGLGKGTSQMTGELFLTLVTLGTWREAQTTLAQWAAQGPPLDPDVAVSPEAMPQRMHQKAMALLQEMIRQARAKVQSLEHGCAEGLFTSFPKVSLAARTGFALPDSLHQLLPGAGGSASTAGAKMQAGWDDKHSVFAPGALPPWNSPEPKYMDQGVA